MRISEVLDKAADAIQERGWEKGGGWHDPRPEHAGRPVCLEGAIQAASGMRIYGTSPNWRKVFKGCDAYQAMGAYLELDLSCQDLYDWNDFSARTQDQVIEVLRAAAAVERAKEESLQPTEVPA